MTLLLHCGANEIDYDGLRDLETPDATRSHVPIAHSSVVDMLKHSLSYYGHEVTEEHHGVTEDGARYFGLLSLKSTYGTYEDTVVLRNSHDKKFPVSIGSGGRVFCCDNLSFHAQHVIKRRHTLNLLREMPMMIHAAVEPLNRQRETQAVTFERYQQNLLTDERADHAILNMYREGVITPRRIPEVLKQWDEPAYEEWGADPTAWRLFNSVTFVLAGRIAENPQVTQRLHNVIDATCEVVN